MAGKSHIHGNWSFPKDDANKVPTTNEPQTTIGPSTLADLLFYLHIVLLYTQCDGNIINIMNKNHFSSISLCYFTDAQSCVYLKERAINQTMKKIECYKFGQSSIGNKKKPHCITFEEVVGTVSSKEVALLLHPFYTGNS